MKKILALGCEIVIIVKLMAVLRFFVYGMCMVGVGGGGFFYVLIKDVNYKYLLMDILNIVEVDWLFDSFY